MAALKAESAARQAQAARAELQAQGSAQAYRKLAGEICAAKPVGTVCEQADKLILGGGQ